MVTTRTMVRKRRKMRRRGSETKAKMKKTMGARGEREMREEGKSCVAMTVRSSKMRSTKMRGSRRMNSKMGSRARMMVTVMSLTTTATP